MPLADKPRPSIYLILAIITVTTVSLVMGVHTYYSYVSTKQEVLQRLTKGMEKSMTALQKNISGLIAAYAVNEYQKLITNELELSTALAIVVDDLKMGEVMGLDTYRSGSIRDGEWQVTDYQPDNQAHQLLLQGSFFYQRHSITDAEGKVIGWLTHYASDRELQQQLDKLLRDNLIDSLAISLVLIVALILAIRYRLLKPIDDIVRSIRHSDADGIPHDLVPVQGPREIGLLSDTINRMITAIDHSRKELITQHRNLQKEKERFHLAVEGTLDGLWDWNLLTNEVYHSPRFETMLGYDVGELPDSIECWTGLLHPEDAESAQRQVRDYFATRGNGVYESTFRLRAKDGSWRWITGRGRAVFGEDGTPIRFLGFNTDVSKMVLQQQELQEQKNLLQYQANHDALTGLANRTLFSDRLEQAIVRARHSHAKLALLFIDLDHFKEINDSLGHRTGDKILNAVSQRLHLSIRNGDTFARFGGDEFSILIEGLKQEQDASLCAEKILNSMTQPFSVDGHELYIGSSIGISIYPDNGITGRDLMKNADAAMYKAKSEGRNNFQYYSSEMTTLAFERLHLESALRSAVSNGEFLVYYQPQINVPEHRIIGVEALVRWQHPKMGLVSPAKFIPIAETTGLVVEIDRIVMRQAMQQLVSWHKQGIDHGILALNLSVKHVHRKDFISAVVASLIETGCSPEWIEFEVTETQVMDNPSEAIQMLHRLDSLGIKVALDDFGTGHSSLAYLKRMPISKLKIDQSFVRDLPDDAEDAAISRAVIALANSLDLEILAEGMERQEQIDFLLAQGCPNAQGFFFSKPLAAAAMTEFYTRWQGKNVHKLFA